ncbi:MAG: FtsK/SpoIIIE domain-containing protein [Rubripirellula sp.]
MKDSSVSPVGLFDTRRQRQLLDGLAERFRHCLDQQQVLQTKHAQQRVQEEEQFATARAQVTAECRTQRRNMLRQWDDADESLTSRYEASAIQNRKDLNRLAALFRRKLADETKVIERKVEARRQAVLQQYENRKNQPGQQKRKEHKLIDESLHGIHENLEWGRALTIRRLDRLPEVLPAEDSSEDMRESTPDSVQDSIETIGRLTRKCNKTVEEMQTGAASKIVDSFYLPAGVAVFLVLWAIAAFFLAPPPPWLMMAAGIIPAGLLGFTIYLILLWPLKRMTRRLYPRFERIGQAAEECASTGRKISAQMASDTSAELVQRRDAHLEAAKRWQVEQIAALGERLQAEEEGIREKLTKALEDADQDFTDSFATVGNEMRSKADAVAQGITQKLAAADQTVQQQREANAAERYNELKRLAARLKDGVGRGLSRITQSDQLVQEHFPDWKTLLDSEPSRRNLDFVPLGSLRVSDSLRQLLQQDAQSNGTAGTEQLPTLLADAEIPTSLPVVLHRRLHSGVVIRAASAHVDQALDLAHQILWRLLCGAPAAQAKLTLIDPLGRGQHFTSFMALADHDPSLVGHRVWTTDNKIDARLGELAHHVEDVLQASLRDRFEKIEDYNEVAGSMAEPYRAVAAVGFPEGLSRDANRHLRALIESGLRCGIFTVLVCDDSKEWPSDMPIPAGEKMLQLHVDEHGDWRLLSEGLENLPFEPAKSPPASLRNDLVEKIGVAAVNASRVEIPLENILSAADEGKGSTTDGIDIVVGSQGANRSLSLELGEGVRQHVLIAGKTGSGKSTLLHSIITSGAHHYRPDQLQYYLLDFKKGVEFKPYAEIGLPHARVIGIESEREFGRSVLQRLDEELQERGEKFRSVGVQELGEYREKASQPLPRIMLVIDEFQELFVRDDRLAGDCAMLLDRLVRQGRSFGMHVILSSQSLAGAYSLPRATLGQMAVRIAMQCSESDAALILSDDNTAARLISRPGEAIYNDAGGLVEGNQPFQVAWLASSRHREMLSAITARDESYQAQLPPPVVFEGNRPCKWTPTLANAAINSESSSKLCGLIGESVEIGPPMALSLSRDTGRNVLLITAAESRGGILASTISGFAKNDPRLEVIYFDGSRVDDAASVAPWFSDAGLNIKTVKTRDSESEMVRISELIQERGDDAPDAAPIVVIVDPVERFRDLRQSESFNFSLDSPGAAVNGGTALQTVLRDGPSANVFVFLVCGSAETLSRWLPRASQHDLELRILGQMNQSDSSLLIDSPMASDLSAATMLMYDDADGRISKFRQCDFPDTEAVKQWLVK